MVNTIGAGNNKYFGMDGLVLLVVGGQTLKYLSIAMLIVTETDPTLPI